MQQQRIASESFERKEMKYRLSASQFADLLALIRQRLQPTEFAESKVTSLYYDTLQFSLIGRSLEKPLYKEKLRLRVYGECFDEQTAAFVEIKKKFKGIVYKRRIAMSLRGALDYLSGMPYEEAIVRHPLPGKQDKHDGGGARSLQIAREIDFMRAHHAPLAPAMLVTCERFSFADESEDLRVTFDTHLRALAWPGRFESLRGKNPSDAWLDIIPPDEAIMEVKCHGSVPLWLAQALSKAGTYQQSFSKYGTAYQKMCIAEGALHMAQAEPTLTSNEPIRVIWPQELQELQEMYELHGLQGKAAQHQGREKVRHYA